jgi:dTDP-4-dehydrorhamnose 3,5-epimerase
VIFSPTEIPDVVLIQHTAFGDHRGFFLESWRADLFAQAGIALPFVQDSHSRSERGVLRGLHYQAQRPQGKLIRIAFGEIFDVAVDLRRSSPTFGRWVSATLSAEGRRSIWIPPGFAHGFYVKSESAEVLYKFTDYYAPQHERVIRWNDPQIGIRWPIDPVTSPVLSNSDAAATTLAAADCYP